MAAPVATPCSVSVETLTPDNTRMVRRKQYGKECLLSYVPGAARIEIDAHKAKLVMPVGGRLRVHSRFVDSGRLTLVHEQHHLKLMLSEAVPAALRALVAAVTAGKQRASPREGSSGGRAPASAARAKTAAAGAAAAPSLPLSPSPRKAGPALRLSEEQMRVVRVVRAGRSIFFTGAAGSGKSVLLRWLVRHLPRESTVVTASTGVAACNIGGTTLHSFAGVGDFSRPLDHILGLLRRRSAAVQRWRAARILIVDEVSMLDGDSFDALDAIARAVRGSDAPFGGIQVILCGDFFQLPPVTARGDRPRYCFQAAAWPRVIQEHIELTAVFRQESNEFVRILNDIRWGVVTRDAVATLRARWNAELGDGAHSGVRPARLFAFRADVEAENVAGLDALRGEERVFRCIDTLPNGRTATGEADGECSSALRRLLDANCPVGRSLRLKEGAQVMLVRNIDPSAGLVNGAQGVVVRFHGPTRLPVVRLHDGREHVIAREAWPVRVGAAGIVSREQLPLALAFAVSIHRAQGVTLDLVEMRLNGVFECGQAYVALSRARSLEGLSLLDRFSPACVRADPKVCRFYRRIRGEDVDSDEEDAAADAEEHEQQMRPAGTTPDRHGTSTASATAAAVFAAAVDADAVRAVLRF